MTGRSYDRGQAVVHLANTSTHQITSFPAYDSGIGKNIGQPQIDRFERVASVDGDILVIEAGFLKNRYKYIINLSKPEFEREEMDRVWNNETNHDVLLHGKLQQR